MTSGVSCELGTIFAHLVARRFFLCASSGELIKPLVATIEDQGHKASTDQKSKKDAETQPLAACR